MIVIDGTVKYRYGLGLAMFTDAPVLSTEPDQIVRIRDTKQSYGNCR